MVAPDGKTKRTWFPILLGLLGGLIAFVLLATIESPSFYRLTALVFNETSPKALFAKPAYFCVHRTVLLMLAAIGATVGAWFSEWPKSRRFLFVLVALLIIGVFSAIGFH
ncbi:MAG: hypothetical protein JW818_10370 [Pirellulales bacterium]|nr:hypothetical protein [Pirellulales bacterium]